MTTIPTIPALLAAFCLAGCIWHDAQDLDTPTPLAWSTVVAGLAFVVVAVALMVPTLAHR